MRNQNQGALKYHRSTFELLEQQPVISVQTLDLVDEVARRFGQLFPAAVREWYSLRDAVAILAYYSNDDHPLEIQELGNRDLSRHMYSKERLLTEGILVFLIENQAICDWAIWLDGSDDPPVLVGVKCFPLQWDIYAERFSDFIYTWIWDFQPLVEPQKWYGLTAKEQSLKENDLEFLHAKFNQKPQTYVYPSDITYRFIKDNQRITIGLDKTCSVGINWDLFAPSEEELYNLARSVWHCGTLAETLEPYSITATTEDGMEEHGPDLRSEKILARLRSTYLAP